MRLPTEMMIELIKHIDQFIHKERKFLKKLMLFVLAIGLVAAVFIFVKIKRMGEWSNAFEFVCLGRWIGQDAQAYFQTTGRTVVNLTYDPVTGELGGEMKHSFPKIWPGLTVGDLPIEKGNSKAFFLSHPDILDSQPIYFSDEGKSTFDPNTLR